MREPGIAVIGLKGLPAYGGAAAVGETLVNKMRKDFQFTVYSVSSHTDMKTGTLDGIEHIVFRKFPVRSLNTLYYYVAASLHALFFRKFDLVQLHHIDAGFLVPILKCKYKVVTTSHGRPQFNDKWSLPVRAYFSLTEKLALRYSNQMISVSDVVKNDYSSLGYENIAYIPNGIHHIPEFDVPKDYDISFAAGRIIPLKGCDLLLRSLGPIKKSPKTVIIGEFHDKAYHEYIKDLAGEKPVVFTGLLRNKQELFRILRSSHLFVFPSRNEAMSMMLLEVVALKIPVICSDIDANLSVFHHDEVLFFKSDDARDLTEKIDYAITNYQEMLERAECAYRNGMARYSWDNIAKRYAELYKGVLHA